MTESASPLVTTHPELHHYTGAEGLSGIVRSNSFRATYFADLNDTTEVRVLKELLAAALSRRFIDLLRSRQRGSLSIRRKIERLGGIKVCAFNLAVDMVRVLYTVSYLRGVDGEPGAEPFVVSFCSHSSDQPYEREHGLLSQWRGYGGDGGYCIVLDTQQMLELLTQERASNYWVHLKMDAVRYATEGLSIESAFPRLLDLCDSFFHGLLDEDPSIVQGDLMPAFIEGSALLKHQGFHEEREVRIVAVPGTQQWLDEMEITEGRPMGKVSMKAVQKIAARGGSRRYVPLFDQGKRKLPILRVIVGPSRHQDQNYDRARAIVGEEVQLIRSRTPFIGHTDSTNSLGATVDYDY